VTECGAKSLFGGYNTFGLSTQVRKTFENLPPHERVLLRFTMYFIDTWDNE